MPIPQPRLRLFNRGGKSLVFDPSSRDKDRIREYLRCKAVLHDYNYPRVSFIFYMPIPTNTSKKSLPKYRSGVLKHDKKPDVDNLIKLYLDCLDGTVFMRDQKIALGSAIKLYGEHPKTVVYICETSEIMQPGEADRCFSIASPDNISSNDLLVDPFDF